MGFGSVCETDTCIRIAGIPGQNLCFTDALALSDLGGLLDQLSALRIADARLPVPRQNMYTDINALIK